jgi:hypothetical protein
MSEQKTEPPLDLTPPHPADGREEQLRKLERLLDAGLLTRAEYELECQGALDEI